MNLRKRAFTFDQSFSMGFRSGLYGGRYLQMTENAGLAVDLPSGINTDTGEAAEGAVRADLTVTFDSCKPLHTAPSSAPFCGEIVCADIGIRDEWHPAGPAQL